MKIVRIFILFCGLVVLWHIFVSLTKVPPYILPEPMLVFQALINHHQTLLHHGLTTLIEIIAGLFLGTVFSVFLSWGVLCLL